MTKDEAVKILETTCLPIDKNRIPASNVNMLKDYEEALAVAIWNLRSNIHYKSKWCFDPQIIGGYYHDGCLARPMPIINGNGATYSKFDHQYRYCPNCGESMFEEVLDND